MATITADQKEQLANDNYKLVHYFVRKYNDGKYNYDDLVSAGNVGFTQAINTFDESKGVKFATYASRCIINQLFMFMRKEKKHLNNISIDTPIFTDKDGSEMTILDTLTTEEEETDWQDINSVVSRMMKQFGEQERNVMGLFFKERNQREIGNELGLSQSYVSRIVKKSLKKIKKEYWRGEKDIMPKLTIEEYQDLKAKGMTDKEIASDKGMAPAYVSQLKKKWFKEVQKPVVEKVKQLPEVSVKQDKTSEYAALISELSDKVKRQDSLIADLQAKVDEYENVKSACNDMEAETANLRKEVDYLSNKRLEEKEFYLDTLEELKDKNIEYENLKNATENNKKVMESYVKENQSLRNMVKELVSLWA